MNIEEGQGLVSAMVDDLRAALMAEIPEFGRHLGYDGKAVESHSTGVAGRGERQDLGSGRRLGEARDVRGRPRRQALDEGDVLVRLQAPRDFRHAARDPGRGVADAGLGVGGEGTEAHGLRADGEGSGSGGALFGVQGVDSGRGVRQSNW